MNGAPNLRPRTVSLLRYAPGLVALAIVIADAGQATDTDLWGHIRFGQAVLAQQHLVVTDPYSYTVHGGPWSNHEWLTEVVMAAAYNALGVVGLKLWKFACVAMTMLMVVLGLAETGAAAAVQLNTLTLVALAVMPQMEFRPQLFTFALFAAMLALLARHNYRGRAPLALVIPMMALWANLHGGFIMGIATLALYAGTAGIEDFVAGAGTGRALRLGALTIAALAATLATPYGLATWSPVLHALRNPVTRLAVTDWQPLIFALLRQWRASHVGVIYMLSGIALMTGFAATAALRPRGGDLPLVVIAAVMSVAAFTAVRNLPLAIIASAAPFARHWRMLTAGAKGRAETGVGAEPEASPPRSAVSPWVAAGIGIVLALYAGIFSPRLRIDKPYPAGAIAFMRTHDLHGNILGDFGWGEYLIWHTAPASRVFIDGRYDTVYPYALIDQYLLFYFDRPGAAAVLSAYPHDFVLIPPASGAYNLMTRQAGWKLIYRDAGSALFARADSAAAKIPAVPIDGGVPAPGYFP